MKELILDTHVWIWLMQGSNEIPSKIKKTINYAAKNTKINISIISTWELCMLEMKKKIIFEKPILTWMNESLALPGMELKPLNLEIVSDSCNLPENEKLHGDPADRLIISTARVYGLTLLTHDKKIIEYGKKNYVSILSV